MRSPTIGMWSLAGLAIAVLALATALAACGGESAGGAAGSQRLANSPTDTKRTYCC